MREAVERLLERHLPVIADALKPAEAALEHPAVEPVRDDADAPTATEPSARPSPSLPTPASPRREAALARRRRRVDRFERVHELQRRGTSIREIARVLDMSRNAVRRYLCRERCPDWTPGRATRSRMDAHRAWIDARLAEGRINASELHGELASRGVRLSYATDRSRTRTPGAPYTWPAVCLSAQGHRA